MNSKDKHALPPIPVRIKNQRIIKAINILAIITLPTFAGLNIAQASEDINIGTPGGSGGNGSSGSQAGAASNGGNGSNGANASGNGNGGNGNSGASGGSGANGTAGTDGSAATEGASTTATIRNVKGQVGLLQIGGDGGAGGTPGESSAGTTGGDGGKGGNGGSGGITGIGGDGGDGGDGGTGGNGSNGGSGGNGATGGIGDLTINQSNFSTTTMTLGGSGGIASNGEEGGAGGDGGKGNSGGNAGVAGVQAAGGFPGSGGQGGTGGKAGNGGNGAQGGNGGSGSLTLNNTTLSVKSALTIGGAAGAGSNGGNGGNGGSGGDAGQTSASNITGEAGDSGQGGNGGAGGKGGQGARGGDGAQGSLTLNNSVLTVQSLAIGADGANGGTGGNSGANGKAGTADSLAAGGKGAAGGQGGQAGDAGAAGTGVLTVENSTLTLTSGLQIGGNGGNGGTGGNLLGSASAGNGGNGSDGAEGTLQFNSGVINNSGALVLGGSGGDAGDGGVNNGVRGRSGNGGSAGNGGSGTAIFTNGSGQIGTEIQLGGQNGSHDGTLNSSAYAKNAGTGAAGTLDIRGGAFTGGALTIGAATVWSALAGTTSAEENQYRQSGGSFQVSSTELNNGSVILSGGLFASKALEANLGTFIVSDDGTAIFGSTELNADNWQESVALLQQTQQVNYNGTLVLSGDTTLDLSSSDLSWRVGGEAATQGLGASSLTVLTAKSWIDSGNAALAMGSAQIDSGAQLLVLTNEGVSAGESFTAVTGSAITTQTAPTWAQSQISTTSRLLTATASSAAGSTLLTLDNADLSTTAPKISGRSVKLLRAMTTQIGVDTTSDNAAQQFVSQAMDVQTVSDTDTAARLVESAINFASIANVAGSSFQVMSATTKAISQHLSQGEHFFKGTPLEEGFNLWTSLLYSDSTLKGYSSGGFNAKTDTWLAGVFVGAEDTLITKEDAILKTGGALNIGKGKGNSSGNVYPVKDDLDFWGASLYGSWLNNNWNLIADVNYSRVSHDMKQSLSAATPYTKLSGETKSTILSGGLTAEYSVESPYADIIPHIGLRYTLLKNRSFDAMSNGKSLFKNGDSSASLWSMPLGVMFSKEFKTASGYTLKPALDLAYIVTTGDTTNGTRVTMAGVKGSAWSESRLADRSAFSARTGLQVQKENMSYGLHYDVQKSAHETSQAVAVSVNIKF
ncbi:autotransporter outer membrane beta-barrel domain-containing protein [Pantoea sp. MBD-2R]|uniref:autotransporter outer membrane beta-barrel domain-containing protein n=1 Tax=Pantoea sp. MBD-2R TaxID=3141540 RepID=UPI00318310ED